MRSTRYYAVVNANNDLRRDVGQLLWVGFEGTSVPAGLARDARRGDIGAAVLFGRNLVATSFRNGAEKTTDITALVALTRALHDAAPVDLPPLWIAMDQEGGSVQRVRAPATVWPPMMSFEAPSAGPSSGDVAATSADEPTDVELATAVGEAVGRELAALGIDIDLAPVLDVHTNPHNPVIGQRAFATDPETAAQRALGFAQGLDRVGVVSCGKHFPGHGDTDIDSHLELPRLAHSFERLDTVELVPFRRAVAAGIPAIMTAHVVFTAVDATVPATLSRPVLRGLLRERLGYNGLVISDDLDMKAIANHFGVGDAAVRAIDAGCDVLLLCRDSDHQQQAREALIRAGTSNSDLRATIGQAAHRVRAAKQRHRARWAAMTRPALSVLGCPEHQALAARLRRGGANQ